MTIATGQTAPDFTLQDQHGEAVSLVGFRGEKPVVLFFYPKDDTPGCTAEACTFRDRFEAFTEAGVEVLGISSDTPESHRRFADKHGLPFRLLSDPGGAVRKAYGVPSILGLLPGRVSFAIDRDGIVRHVFNSQFNPTRHVAEALAAVKTL
jgi:peroxiredoxin Q/BCP